ncbi:YoaK family protein [Verrucomicrobium sp. BvORR034]|uniref:YoaK family protein n=1 Tax=Verrucomicrobium sp. BvORR034 TaxID=1396418 RepID=UPI000678C134|nr:YoaK family protein [Verrucomicrobium sp. BvORR034]
MSVHFHPKLAVVTGCLLATLSAGVNASYLMRLGTSVSHLTGDVAKVALSVVSGNDSVPLVVVQLGAATLGFITGAATAGFLIHHPNIEFSRPYGRSVVALGLFLALAYLSLDAWPTLSMGLAGLACGLQNALATHYRGMILRTTHVTGLLTDFGTNLGMKLRGHDIAGWKLSVPLLLATSFFMGSLLGCVAFQSLGDKTLLVYAGIYLGLGLLWAVYRLRWVRTNSVHHSCSSNARVEEAQDG